MINVAWLACAVALGLAFYGQTRLLGVKPLPAVVSCYLLLSLPLLNSQVALAGTADIWMASVYGLAAMACFHWLRSGDRRQGLLALGLALACSQIKVPGMVWMLTFVPALLLPRLSRRRLAQLATASAVAVVLWLASGGLSLRLPGGHPFELTPQAVRLPYLGNYSINLHPGVLAAFAESAFSLASWHLFWYAWPLVVLWRSPFLLRDRASAFLFVLALSAFAFVGGSYLLTPLAAFALDFTQANRTALHMTPMLLFMAVALLQTNPAVLTRPGSGRGIRSAGPLGRHAKSRGNAVLAHAGSVATAAPHPPVRPAPRKAPRPDQCAHRRRHRVVERLEASVRSLPRMEDHAHLVRPLSPQREGGI